MLIKLYLGGEQKSFRDQSSYYVVGQKETVGSGVKLKLWFVIEPKWNHLLLIKNDHAALN